jgi:hypothetical protein
MITPFYDFAAAISDFVSHPDYYKGRWFVQWGGRKKVCSNYETACAWSKYIRRNFDRAAVSVGRADPLPGFPRQI